MTKYKSNQNASDFSIIKRMFPDMPESGVDDYLAKTNDIIKLLNEVSPLSGVGSPEGVFTSNLSQIYIDTSVPRLYWNPAYAASTGWVAL